MMLRVSQLAAVVYGATTAYLAAHDGGQPDWDKLHPEHRAEAIRRARFHLDNPDAPISALHDQERNARLASNTNIDPAEIPTFDQLPEGWRWGVKLEKWICVGMRDYVDRDAQDPEPAQGALQLGEGSGGQGSAASTQLGDSDGGNPNTQPSEAPQGEPPAPASTEPEPPASEPGQVQPPAESAANEKEGGGGARRKRTG